MYNKFVLLYFLLDFRLSQNFSKIKTKFCSTFLKSGLPYRIRIMPPHAIPAFNIKCCSKHFRAR